jgi:hypothetical protein
VKNLINLIINFIKRVFTYVQTLFHNPTQPETVQSSPRKRYNPPWWKRLYNLESRDQVPSTHLYPLRPFGNCKARAPFYKPKKWQT